MNTEQEPLVPPEPPAIPNQTIDPMVQLEQGKAPLSEILAMANSDCRFCNGKGTQAFTVGGKRQDRICGCAARAMNRKLRGDDPFVPVGRVEKNPEVERRTAQAKLDRMTAALTKTEAGLAERIEGHDRGIAEAEDAQMMATVQHGSAVCILEGKRRDRDTLQEQLERTVRAIAVADARIEVAIAFSEERSQKLLDAQRATANIRHHSAAILASAEGVRHRIKRLQDRIALHRLKHADVLEVERGE